MDRKLQQDRPPPPPPSTPLSTPPPRHPRSELGRAAGALVLVVLLAGILVAAGVYSWTRSLPSDSKHWWAKTSVFQDDDAAKRSIPVARETDLGGGERMRFVWIPPGTFTMGSPPSEVGRSDDETQHEVELTKGYYLSIHEVTNGQYRRFKPDHDSGEYKGEGLNGSTQPVSRVSHDDATAFVGWLNGRGGSDRYRLPTESEWEYAARAGTTTSRWWGSSDDGARGRASVLDPQSTRRFGLIWDAFPFDDGHRVTAPVGTFSANGWGLYDMLGNVQEWCSGWFVDYPHVASPTARVRDPQGASIGTTRVLRGGSWISDRSYVRSAYRFFVDGSSGGGTGIRVVLVAPP